MIRLAYSALPSRKVGEFWARREGPFVVVDGRTQFAGDDPVTMQVLCCASRDRHRYTTGVFTLHRHDDFTWYVEAGPHFAQRDSGHLDIVNDAFELRRVPAGVDFFQLQEAP